MLCVCVCLSVRMFVCLLEALNRRSEGGRLIKERENTAAGVISFTDQSREGHTHTHTRICLKLHWAEGSNQATIGPGLHWNERHTVLIVFLI